MEAVLRQNFDLVFGSSPSPPVADLVARYRASKERGVFDQLYRQTRRRVFSVALHYLKDSGRAEDVCHDAFVRAYEGFDGFSGDHFEAWVSRIAANLALNRLRDRSNRERLLHHGAAGSEPEPAPERRAMSGEDLERAMEIIVGLGDDQRRCLLLCHVDGLSYAEIAERTGLDGDAIRSHLQNARRNFRNAWRVRVGAQEDDHG